MTVTGPHIWLIAVKMLPAAKSSAQGVEPGGNAEIHL